MKITAILTALLLSVSVSYAAEGDKKPAESGAAKPAEEGAKKPAEGAKKPVDMAAVFAKKDANSDGKVSKEEFLKGSKDAAKSEKQFAAKDKDKDGNLTKEEFTAVGGKKKDK